MALIKVFDRLLQQLSSNSLFAILGIHQNHPNPGKPVLIRNGSRCSHDLRVVLHDEAAVRTILKEAAPISGRLIPSRKGIQSESRWNIPFGHDTQAHPEDCKPGKAISEARGRVMRNSSTIARRWKNND